jgi:UDP-3-O-[3-hydroxymyristoyl] glucosamine N-acyltransferase
MGNNIEVGALTCICRGTIDDTLIGDNVKIDDHVFIAHNVQIGENSVVIAGAEVSGSVKIGKNSWIGPQSTIINGVEIGESSMVGIGAVVTKPVTNNVIVAGNPAKVLRRK